MEINRTINFAGTSELTGFRLDRLEVFNWGTFHGAVHVLRMNGLTALLTGPNGSGKSTLVDAMLTLLVPYRMGRNYNMASGIAKKKERTEKTYIQGVWAEGLISEGSSAVEPKRLRPAPGTPAVLLAVFRNQATAQWVSIAQVLWISGDDVEHVYIVTSDERSITGDFRELGDTRKLRKTLVDRKMEPLPSFDAYAETFCRRMHLAYPSALSLFNTVVSIKETGDIAQFIREHMLSRYDEVDGLLAQAQQQLDDLERCAREIELAKRQLELLAPVAKGANEVTAARKARDEVRSLQDGWPRYFAHVIAGQARARIDEIDREAVALGARRAEIATECDRLSKERDDAVRALAGLPEAQILADLDNRISAARKRKEQKEAARTLYDNSLRELGIRDGVRSDAQFRAMRDRTEKKRAAERGAFEEAIGKRSELSRLAVEKRKEQQEKLREIVVLRQSRSNIRSDLLGVREKIMEATGIPATRLPFAGELIEVRTDRQEWRPVLEILLGTFGRSLLVEPQDYRVVVDFLHATNIHTQLDFNLVEVVNPSAAERRTGDAKRVLELLNIRPDHQLRGWVAEEIRRRFSHVCCETKDEFRRLDYGIMAARLIRNGPSRHSKNDNPRNIDPEHFVLGWNNESLLKTLEERAKAAGEQAQKLEDQARRMESTKQASDNAIDLLDKVLRIERYDEINHEGELADLRAAEDARIKLRAGDNKLLALSQAKERAEGELVLLRASDGTLLGQQSTLSAERQRTVIMLDEMNERLAPADPTFAPDTFGESIRPFVGRRSITLADAAKTESEVTNTLIIEDRKRGKTADLRAADLVQAMGAFLVEFPQFKVDFAANADRTADYLNLMNRVEKEQLPELKDRFKRLMNERVVQDMALLQSKLEESVRDYQAVVIGLNESLKEIEYNAGTHIQIIALQSKGAVVAQFRRDLKDCLPGATVPTDETRQRAFEQIRALLTKLRTDEWWRRDVIDTRNWLDFRIDEIDRHSGLVVNNYSSSVARSGGQKAKLAFTVMASAIAHQYGLLRSNAEEKSFRFVVIDEIFGKTDEANSVYALKLFQKFKLQLLVVCPFTAQARVVDEFVGSYHLTSNPEWNNSTLLSATLEQINAARGEPPDASTVA